MRTLVLQHRRTIDVLQNEAKSFPGGIFSRGSKGVKREGETEEVGSTCQRHKGGSNFVRGREHGGGVENGPVFSKEILKRPGSIRVFIGIERTCLKREERHVGVKRSLSKERPFSLFLLPMTKLKSS